jgi:hypothetical protein
MPAAAKEIEPVSGLFGVLQYLGVAGKRDTKD